MMAIRWRSTWCLFSALFVLLPCPARAQTEVKIPEVADSAIANLIQVPVPLAGCAALSDSAGVLAIGHKSGITPHVTFFRLSAQGKPIAAPPAANLTLPRPAGLAKYPNYPLSLAFHPKLPLLYVWQDIAKPETPTPAEVQSYDEFDHLLIYRIDEEQPRLLQAVCRGPLFACGTVAGSVALNPAGTRLYVPNQYEPPPAGKPPDAAVVGYFQLDDAGLPQGKGAGPAGRLGRIAPATAAFPGVPVGLGFIPISDDVVLVGGGYGPVTWNEADRHGRFSLVALHLFFGAYYRDRIAGHPTLPLLFASVVGTSWVCRMEHVDGVLTLTPQVAVLEGATLRSPPAFLGRHNQVAFGGDNKVYVLSLDDRGHFPRQRVQAAVPCPAVEALVYSEKLDRLYVAVETAK
jgi:hypothetical protein